MATDSDDALWLHAQARVSLVELAQCSGLPEPVLRELVEYGALSPADADAVEWAFGGDCLARARTAARLRNDLELDTSALALVLSLLEQIHELDAQVRHMSAQLVAPRRG